MNRYSYFIIFILITFSSCEKVVEIDLNASDPALFIDASISRDSVCVVRLTSTTSFFSPEEPGLIEDALISISDGDINEDLVYVGKGYYKGSFVAGSEGKTYTIEIDHDGIMYRGSSYMPAKAEILSYSYGKSNEQSILNPDGETVFTVRCSFIDDPLQDNYYMITYTEDGNMIERRYFMLTEHNSNGGSLEYTGVDTLRFSESIFYEGGEVKLSLYTIDKSIYQYFTQLDDVLFWKRRYLPPVPYNPLSNIDNGALGYFAAWNFDTETFVLE